MAVKTAADPFSYLTGVALGFVGGAMTRHFFIDSKGKKRRKRLESAWDAAQEELRERGLLPEPQPLPVVIARLLQEAETVLLDTAGRERKQLPKRGKLSKGRGRTSVRLGQKRSKTELGARRRNVTQGQRFKNT